MNLLACMDVEMNSSRVLVVYVGCILDKSNFSVNQVTFSRDTNLQADFQSYLSMNLVPIFVLDLSRFLTVPYHVFVFVFE